MCNEKDDDDKQKEEEEEGEDDDERNNGNKSQEFHIKMYKRQRHLVRNITFIRICMACVCSHFTSKSIQPKKRTVKYSGFRALTAL